MKKIITALVLILAIAFFAYAESLKIVVISLTDKTGEYAQLAEELTGIVVKEVEKSGNKVVPEYPFFVNWWKASCIAWEVDKPVPALEEYEAKKKSEGGGIETIFNHDALGMIISKKQAWRVDDWDTQLAVLGEIRKSDKGDKGIEIYSEIISIETGRYYYSVKQTEPEQAKSVIREEIKSLLGSVGLIRKAEADEEMDAEYSKVIYNVKTRSGQIIKIQIDYTSDRPDPPIQQVEMFPPPELKEGIKSYRIFTKQKKDIIVEFCMKNDKLEYARVDSASHPETAGKEYQETLTITSGAGYDIDFKFLWKDNEIKSVECAPSRNPYSCRQAGKD
ncbi:MAG: hypothetical protein V1933_03920 [Candidatus Omnitrophota bacterium]